MLSFWNISLLVVIFCSDVLGQKLALKHQHTERQIFASLESCIGTTCTKTSSTSPKSSFTGTSTFTISSPQTTSTSTVLTTTSATPPSSSIIPSSSTVTSTTFTTPSPSYNQYELTTTFTQPPACTDDGFTALGDWGTGGGLFNNLIYSAAGYDLGYTSCYPPQFYSSVLALQAYTTLGPFTKLICPSTWENYDLNSTYVVCCPKGYSLLAPYQDDPIRPGIGAACSSYIGARALIDVTIFDLMGGQTIVPITAGPDGTAVWANAFDGITTSVSQTSALSSLATTISTSFSSLSKTVSGTSSSSAKTSSASATPKSTSSSIPTSSSSSIVTTSSTAIPGESNLPACGKTCFETMLAQYSSLGCSLLDSNCLCSNVNFVYGLRNFGTVQTGSVEKP